jgi:hypothetical protein
MEATMPASKDISIWRGNTETFPVEVKARAGATIVAVNLTGSTLQFRAQWDGGSLIKDLDITDAALGLAELRLTASETRSIPQGSAARYEIERRVGSEQKTILYGRLVASGGLNLDA